MPIKVGLNGFGRIGRLVTRLIGPGHPDLELVHVNARADTPQLAHLLKYDSVHRTSESEITTDGDSIIIDGNTLTVSRHPTPGEIPWGDMGVEIVIESTGKFATHQTAEQHIKSGAKKVVLSAPGKETDGHFVVGVNHHEYDPERCHVISNASCTTNCLAPVAKVLHDAFFIESGLMTTVHAYTMKQRVLDGTHKDIRRGRASFMSIIPTTTGAAKAVGEVIPELKGKIDGIAVRVPTPDVSMVDFSCVLGKKDVTAEEINQALSRAAEGPMKDILTVTEVPLVSVDYTSSHWSAIVEAPLTQAKPGGLGKVFAWYDNEMGFAVRLVELTSHVARLM